MSNNETINKNRIDVLDKLNDIVSKLEFVSDSIYNWNETDFDHKHKAGFSSIMDDIISEIKTSAVFLEENK